MKKFKYTPKSILVATSMIALMSSSFNAFAQDGIIWSQTQNFDNLGIYRNNDKVFSSNEEIQQLINNFSINNISKAVPASKSKELQNLVEITCNCDETDLLLAVSKLTTIFIQPEIGPHYETLFTPDDFSLAFANDYALNLINATQAWDVTHGNSSIIIAISDQNFQPYHEELTGKVHHYDTTNTQSNVHGTAVAVTAAGNTDNTIGKSAIGYNSGLALYQMNYNDIVSASNEGYRVINTSWTSGCFQSSYVQQIVDEVYANGSIIVAAAGNGATCNGPSNLVYPAACDHVISVTGIGETDNHERIPGDSLSTFQHNATVDISAPGILVPVTIGNGSYIVANGTSFAAPLVSGTIALMLSVDSCLTFEDIETILYSTAVDIDALNPSYAGKLGHGRLDAGAAVTMASTYMSCTNGNSDPTPEPEPTTNADGKINEITIPTQSTAGIEENLVIDGDYKLFPNPASSGGTIKISSENAIEKCEILGLNGEVIQVVLPTANEININELSQGSYFVKVSFENETTKVKRLIVF